jgi:hypothetical protein
VANDPVLRLARQGLKRQRLGRVTPLAGQNLFSRRSGASEKAHDRSGSCSPNLGAVEPFGRVIFVIAIAAHDDLRDGSREGKASVLSQAQISVVVFAHAVVSFLMDESLGAFGEAPGRSFSI